MSRHSARFTATGILRCFHQVVGILLVSIIILPVPIYAASPQGLERLFTTSEQRARLDMLRRQNGDVRQRETSSTAAVSTSHLKINGIVTGSDGRRVLWVNGKASASGDARVSAGTRARLAENGWVMVQRKDQRNSILLKAGQVLDLDSGRVHEYYEKPDSSRSETDDAR